MQVIQKTNVVYKVKSSDTIASICALNKVSKEQFIKLNGTNDVFENQLVELPKQYKKIYIVQPLDTIDKIAKEMNVSVQDLKNELKDKKIYIGQKIIL